MRSAISSVSLVRPGPGAQEPHVGGGGVDAEHDRGFGDAHDAEGAAAEGFGVLAFEVAEPAFDAAAAAEGGDPVGAACAVPKPRVVSLRAVVFMQLGGIR